MTSAISILRIIRKHVRSFFEFFGNVSFVSLVRFVFIKQLAWLRFFWSENHQNPSHPRDFSVVWRFSIFGRALSTVVLHTLTIESCHYLSQLEFSDISAVKTVVSAVITGLRWLYHPKRRYNLVQNCRKRVKDVAKRCKTVQNVDFFSNGQNGRSFLKPPPAGEVARAWRRLPPPRPRGIKNFRYNLLRLAVKTVISSVRTIVSAIKMVVSHLL